MSTEKTGTPLSTIATVINNIIGAGLLALPYTFYRSSLIPGIVSMVVTGILNMVSMIILARNCELSGARSYKELSEIAFGKRSATVIALVMAIYTLGSCVSYVVLLGDALPELIDNAGDPATDTVVNFWTNRANILPICATAILLPLANHRNLSSLRFTATASFICIVYTALMIAVRAGRNPVSSSIVYVKEGPGVFVGIPITMVSFTMHYNTPRYWHELQNATIKTFTFIAFVCFGFALAIYELTATSGYLMFGNDTKGDILENFADNDEPAFAARVALVLVMFFSYPLAFNSYRASVHALLPSPWQQRIEQGIIDYTDAVKEYKEHLYTDIEVTDYNNNEDDDNANYRPSLSFFPWIKYMVYSFYTMVRVDWPHICLTTILVGLTVIVAIALPQLEVILGYKGALGGTLIVYVFPVCMYFIFCSRLRHGYAVNPLRNNIITDMSSPTKTHHSMTKQQNYQTPVPMLRSWSAGLFSVFSNTKTVRSDYTDTGGPEERDPVDRSYTPLLWAGASTPSSTVTSETTVTNDHENHHSLVMDSPVQSTGKNKNSKIRTGSSGSGMETHSTEESSLRTPMTFGQTVKELYTTSDGILAICFTLWGLTVMVFGTLTTAGLVG